MDKRATKHSISRSSLFASPSIPKQKKVAKEAFTAPSETIASIAPSQSETETFVCEVEPMEVDESTTQVNEETVKMAECQNEQKNNDSTANASSSATTPRRKSIPAVGKRRSICFSREIEQLNNNVAESGTSGTTDVVESDQSTIFELLVSDSQLQPEMQPLKRYYEELQALKKYDDELTNQLDKFDHTLKNHKKQCENAQRYASLPYLAQYKSTKNSESRITNFDDLMTSQKEKKPIDVLLKLYSNYKKLTEEESVTAKLQKRLDEEVAKKELMLEKKRLLLELAAKYRRDEEEKARVNEKINNAKAKLEKSREALCNVLEMAKKMTTINIC